MLGWEWFGEVGVGLETWEVFAASGEQKFFSSTAEKWNIHFVRATMEFALLLITFHPKSRKATV